MHAPSPPLGPTTRPHHSGPTARPHLPGRLDVLVGNEVNGAPPGPGGPRSRRWPGEPRTAILAPMRWVRCPSCGAALTEDVHSCWACDADLAGELLPLEPRLAPPPPGRLRAGSALSGRPRPATPAADRPTSHRPTSHRVVGALAVLLAAVLVGGAFVDRVDPRADLDEGPAPPARNDASIMPATIPDGPPDTLPAGWAWRPVGPLRGRQGHVVAWTGTEVVLWGGDRPGRSPEGAAWNPESDRWRRIAPAPLSNRMHAASAWTGREVLVWGGLSGRGLLDDGAAYDPAADRWRPLARAPLSGRMPLASAWTGDELVVVGSKGYGFTQGITEAAAYDPAADTWRLFPPVPVAINEGRGVWTGREIAVYGGYLDRGRYPTRPDDRAIGAVLDPAAGRWRELPAAPLSGQALALAWDGMRVVGWDYELRAAVLDLGAAGGAGRWTDLPPLPLRRASCLPAGVAAGRLIYAQHCGQAALFDTAARAWRAIESPRGAQDAPVYTGRALVHWLGPSGRPFDGTWLRPLT